MKLINIFIQIFATFAFLTIGSLMIIVSLHVLTMEDALLKVQEIYENPWQALQMGVTGIFFIFSGLIFAKGLVKKARRNDDVILYGKWGYVTVSIKAIDDLVRKSLKKFDVVREMKIETDIDGNRLKITANLSVLAGWNLPELVNTVQTELTERLMRMLGGGVELELIVNIIKIIEQPAILERI
ncbi:MAG: hypothetical protein A3C35_01655 [Omnitrophica bacterium RIFCSPHIGHO2_02_FULL_46_11]|nr:MAG: hypothetical protein A3C35_01655 [Omnitrophica bacterium RIFCSPHIGHO2_02_FULL_46_11]OGW85351.1 MAG: hypothetical protein A3A81_04235 [Omnitrophica bacterium RIFCSPLOWO2_01_FULL_45_10b]